ncbi:prepilin-type N-terminal cleavage/methylation domain-containing protein [Virgibacillus dakarensis]|nr:prepilin-type N-terminal cleavage/methylation domain-containing protein [Virgibacillus dakarensis]
MRKNGFTLLEVIFVLGIWSLLILLSAPIQFSILDKQTEEQFFRTFESDILLMQSMSYAANDKMELKINKNNNHYTIEIDNGKTLIERAFPSDWKIDERLLGKGVSFNKLGTIKQPGRIKVVTTTSTYHIVFPLGKGRCYIEKQ